MMFTARLPLLGPTKGRILELLLARPRTAKETAEALHIQTSAARKHLERLKSLEIVSEDYRRGGTGRPKKMYLLTETGRELFPRRYDMVLNATLTKVAQERGPGYTESLMKQIATDISDNLDHERHDSQRLKRVRRLLDNLGFMSEIKLSPDSYDVKSWNCPILQTARVHQEVVCRGIHEEVLKRVFGAAKVEREKWILNGDAFCAHQIAVTRKPKPKQIDR